MTYAAIFYFTTSDEALRAHLEEVARRWGAEELGDTAWGFREQSKRIDDFLYLLWNNRGALDHRAVLFGGPNPRQRTTAITNRASSEHNET